MLLLETRLKKILTQYLSPIIANTVLRSRLSASRIDINQLRPGDRQRLLTELKKGIRLYLKPGQLTNCFHDLEKAISSPVDTTSSLPSRHQKVPIKSEMDIVVARNTGRQKCLALGFSSSTQVKMATAISELARNIIQYAGEGEITLHVSQENGKAYLQVTAKDKGPGIPNIEEILSGQYRSSTGMGKGLTGTRNMVDEFEIQSCPELGTRIVIRKWA